MEGEFSALPRFGVGRGSGCPSASEPNLQQIGPLELDRASNHLLCVCRVILESDPQQVVHRVALRVSRNVYPHLSTGPPKPGLLGVAEGQLIHRSYLLLSSSRECIILPASPSLCPREAEELAYVSKVEPSVLYGLFTKWSLLIC